jgi:hypothetical protein
MVKGRTAIPSKVTLSVYCFPETTSPSTNRSLNWRFRSMAVLDEEGSQAVSFCLVAPPLTDSTTKSLGRTELNKGMSGRVSQYVRTTGIKFHYDGD